MNAKGSALVIAILLTALAGVLATALTELGRLALRRARLDRDGVRAWYLAEAALAEATAAVPPGRSFTTILHAMPGPPDASGAAWTSALGFSDDGDGDEHPNDPMRDVNARVVARVNAFGPPPVRRRLEAVLGRRADPLQPGALTLGGDARALTADFLLDGRDFDMSSACTLAGTGQPRAGLALPDGAGLPILAGPGQVVGRGAAPSIERHAPPAFAEVAADPRATHVAGGALAPTLGTVAAPAFTIVDGDAAADAVTSGAGALYVAGRLRVHGRLAFTGLVAAAGGIEVAPGAVLELCGGAWAAGASAFDARGTGFVRASSTALRMAAALAPLPARARVLAVREAS